MERYFLGNNSAYGFWSNYENELKDKDKVVLLKGGPGTGKSSMLKKIANVAKNKGYDYELWYCSGDPKSLDGVFVKDVNVAVIDATSPHAVGADLPIIRDVIFDLATSLNESMLLSNRQEIVELIKIKKQWFTRAYQHLKLAFCHLQAQFELESQYINEGAIRAYATVVGKELRAKCKSYSSCRKLFTKAICPSGESEYFDFLRDKKIYKVCGLQKSKQVFFDELKNLMIGDTHILNALDPNVLDGIVLKDTAVVCELGHFADGECERIDLGVYEKPIADGAVLEEKNEVAIEIAKAIECLNKARDTHLKIEEYFVPAMNFDNNDRIYRSVLKEVFGD